MVLSQGGPLQRMVGMAQVSLSQHTKLLTPVAVESCLKTQPQEASKPESK